VTENDVIVIVNYLLEKGISLSNVTYISILLISLISGFIGAFLSSYAKTKGQHYATKEDLDELSHQTQKLTEITESVKFEVANNSRVESKKWELKLSIYTDILTALSTWRILTAAMSNDLYEHDGELKREFEESAADERIKRVASIFEDMARIESLSVLVLDERKASEINKIRSLVSAAAGNYNGKECFKRAVLSIKTLEINIAKIARDDLFNLK
jgi:hypothetical protein